MTPADRKLKLRVSDWEKLCPKNVSDVEKVREALSATNRLKKELSALKFQFRRKGEKYKEFDEDSISKLLDRVQEYQGKLEELEKDVDLLRRSLTRARSSDTPVPFALVVKGTSDGNLHVFCQESRVDRSAREGKQDLSGAKIEEGTCVYTGGKLVFRFNDGPKAPWKAILQKLLNQADVNMKVKLDGLADETAMA